MYSLLIVDRKDYSDEVHDFLMAETDMELDLLQAESAEAAIRIMNRQKIDIVISEMNMPRMNGLEFYHLIREKWPFSKVIFLTGAAEFSYVYQVQEHARYLLKAEMHEKLAEAIRESIQEIESDLLLENPFNSRNNPFDMVLDNTTHERGIFMQCFLKDSRTMQQYTPKTADWLKIPFGLNDEVCCLLLHHQDVFDPDFRKMRLKTVNLYRLVKRCFLYQQKGIYFEADGKTMVVLVAPLKMLTMEQMTARLTGNAELFISAAEKNLNTSFSVLIGDRKIRLKNLPEFFGRINNETIWMENGEIRIAGIREKGKISDALSEARRQEVRQLLWRAEAAMDGMDEQETLQLLKQLENCLQSTGSMRDLFALEIYSAISAKLLHMIKRMGISEDTAYYIGNLELFNVSSHSSWGEAFYYLRQVAENIFAIKKQSEEQQTEETVDLVKKYILDHLAGDTSLFTLAEQVHFSQEYLLRIFKKQEGITILQYINNLKLEKAKELLRETNFQMKEIAEILGFHSAGYFGRFFRSKMGMTPQSYREQMGTGYLRS